jgi:hypothetical protein
MILGIRMSVLNRERLNPLVNKIMDGILMIKQDIPESLLLVAINYSLAEISSNLRGTIKLYSGVTKPLNFYAYAFGRSGIGKDLTLNALNSMYVNDFKAKMEKGFNSHRVKYWDNRLMQLVDEGNEDSESIIKEEQKLVSPFSYRISSGTEAGISKYRVTCSHYKIGAVNLVIDELGLNYGALRGIAGLMLSTYEDGSSDARQLKESGTIAVSGVPSNMLLYSSPDLCFDGGLTEKMIIEDLTQGLGRRSFCAYVDKPESKNISAKERVRISRANADENKKQSDELSKYFADLASPSYMYREVTLTEDAEIALAEYQIKCENIVNLNPDMQEAEKIELANRSWKATRLAGIYCFVSKQKEISREFAEQAIYVAEISGKAFERVFNQPPLYERLFHFIKGRDKTSVIDLERTSFFKGNKSQKNDLIALSRAYGYENDYLFKIKEVEKVEFYSFMEVPKTDIDKITISISKNITEGFKKKVVPFEVIHEVICSSEYNYSAGTFKDGYRNKENYERNQNLIIIDIDDGVKLETAKLMFNNYKCFISTTKSHQKDKNGLTCDRFRIIFITDRTIKLDSETYSRFMTNVYESLGIPCDISCKDSSRFYYGAEGEYWYSEGTKLFEISSLIPDTTKDTERKTMLSRSGIGSSDGIERILLEEAIVGGRSNAIIRYGLFLVDEGYDYESVENKILEFNDKLPDGLSIKELKSTVLKTVSKKYKD